MLGSNQRPLPCEGGAIIPCLFADVRKPLQNNKFFLISFRLCSLLFEWGGVLISVHGGSAFRQSKSSAKAKSPLAEVR